MMLNYLFKGAVGEIAGFKVIESNHIPDHIEYSRSAINDQAGNILIRLFSAPPELKEKRTPQVMMFNPNAVGMFGQRVVMMSPDHAVALRNIT